MTQVARVPTVVAGLGQDAGVPVASMTPLTMLKRSPVTTPIPSDTFVTVEFLTVTPVAFGHRSHRRC